MPGPIAPRTATPLFVGSAACSALEKARNPTRRRDQRPALGGGLKSACRHDERVLSNDRGVLVGLPEIKLGLPGVAARNALPRLVGTALGRKMLLIGEPLTAAQALECGLA